MALGAGGSGGSRVPGPPRGVLLLAARSAGHCPAVLHLADLGHQVAAAARTRRAGRTRGPGGRAGIGPPHRRCDRRILPAEGTCTDRSRPDRGHRPGLAGDGQAVVGVSPPTVLGDRDRLEVVGSHAVAHPAEVVDLMARGDGAHLGLVGPPVARGLSPGASRATHGEHPVPARTPAADPEPAPVRTLLDAIPEPAVLVTRIRHRRTMTRRDDTWPLATTWHQRSCAAAGS